METRRYVNLRGVLLDRAGLEKHIKNIGLSFEYIKNSDKKTFPMKHLKDDYKFILSVYKLLNNHIKLGIKIHSAGEWLLDNFYIIEENVKYIEKELTLKKYKKLVGIKSGEYKGIPRILILSEEIVAYTDSRLDFDNLEIIMKAYSNVDSLSLSEIECFDLFLKMAIIRRIREVCEKIYISQIQKYKVENLIERLIEQKTDKECVFKYNIMNKFIQKNIQSGRNSYIEYLSYKLKTYGKITSKYQELLDKEVEKIGETVSEIIRKEHINVASLKVTIGNGIMSLKRLGHISFVEMYGSLNIAERNLKEDPSNVYSKMDNKTQEMYRREIEKISRKYKLSEKFITEKILNLCRRNIVNNQDKENDNDSNREENLKKTHVGYYIVDTGKIELFKELKIDTRKLDFFSKERKEKIYISSNVISSIICSFFISFKLFGFKFFLNGLLTIVCMFLLYIPVSEIVLRIINYLISKFNKPKNVPKLNYEEGIPDESKTFVVIPCIIKDTKKIDELFRKIEVYYLANKMDNLYFAVLGDSTEETKKLLDKDNEIINYGLKKIKELNNKYDINQTDKFNRFHFLYRERKWNSSEGKYIGWERKRGLLYTFNLYIKSKIKDDFLVNTIEFQKSNIPNIKYVITLDADTALGLDTAYKMIGSMDHVLNKPILKENDVVSGYGIMQPKVGIDLDNFNKSLFTRLYSKQGGIDFYSQASFDVYQDIFGEGIFTGKGIYNVDVFIKTLENEIPENTVLSHDLLEGNFLRTMNLSDVMLLDGFPSKYLSYIFRNHRWVRGDIQIWKWLFSKRLNRISKFKIYDNIRRTLIKPVSLLLVILACLNLNVRSNFIFLVFLSLGIMYLLEFFNNIVFKESLREGSTYAYKKFSGEFSNTKITVIRMILDFMFLPYEGYKELDGIVRSIYRMKNKTKLLEWTTSEETDNQKVELDFYYNEMIINVILGMFVFFIGNIYFKLLGIIWVIAPFCAWNISKEYGDYTFEITENDKKYLINIAEKTWGFFKDNINKENNYLITDNYQEDRKIKTVDRTSSTNIGLELIVIISAYDMKFINLKDCVSYLKNILFTVQNLEKWNGHLYNWYNTKTLKPLIPKYISTVDSGNFVGYLYIVKNFLESNKNKEDVKFLLEIVKGLIENTNFKILYNNKTKLFSIGFNVEQNKLTDSYYDLLASEARQASLVAIAKRDIKLKHWNNLSRTLTNLKEYKGLISWSGTAFEYLMPNINFKRYRGSLLDESSIFAIESQIKYANTLNIPWGISESAYNIKDLNNNYQYKAFGIPWLGLKRGLEEEVVISPYSTFLSLEYKGNIAIDNLKKIENLGGLGKYGFYESIDFTQNRMPIDKKYIIVKCFMAHHQGLIFLSINNFINDYILRKRFNDNPEIDAVNVLLQENMPKNVIITKETKEKIEKKKLKQDSGYIEYNVDSNYLDYNVISNMNYNILINNLGESRSVYKGKNINNYKDTSIMWQGIGILCKNLNSRKILDVYKDATVKFYPDKVIFTKEDGAIIYELTILIDPNRNIEIRKLNIKNNGNKDELIEVTSYFNPILTEENEYRAHPVFNNLFLNVYKYNFDSDDIYIEKHDRELKEFITLGVSMFSEAEVIDSGFEINKNNFYGRLISKIPYMIEKDIQFSNKLETAKEYVVAMKKIIRVPMKESININLILSIAEEKEEARINLEEVKSDDEINRINEMSKARVEEECKYLGVKTEELEIFRKFISYFSLKRINEKRFLYDINDVWKFGISGDNLIFICEIENIQNIYELERILKLYEYLRAKSIYFDLVIIDDEKNIYEKFLRDYIENIILNMHLDYLRNINTGIFVLNKNELEEYEYDSLKYLSSVFIKLEDSNLESYMRDNKILKRIDKSYYKRLEKSNISIVNSENINNISSVELTSNDDKEIKDNIEFYNGIGGFINDGKEYLIKSEKNKKLNSPMVNLIGNNRFGQIISDNFSGMIWYKNSRLNRITSWENDICFDMPNEIYYLYDKEKDYIWSLNSNLNENNVKSIVYGLGYAKYRIDDNNFDINIETIIPENKTYKIMKFKMKNKEERKRNISFASFVKLVLGEDEVKENKKINIYEKENVLYAENSFKSIFMNKAFAYTNIPLVNFTNSMSEFFGKEKKIDNPRIIYKNVDMQDEGIKGIGYKINLNFEEEEEKIFYIVIGVLEENEDIDMIKNEVVEKYDVYLGEIKNKWKNITSIVNIKTPSLKTDYLVNGWLAYQTIQSRLSAKSGFYQSGGAEGFRDQLQDAIGLKHYDIDILKEQIIKCARHQFVEGDVLHWWHSHNKKGVRTMFSDDLLWLVYATFEYIDFSGDSDVLFEQIEYLQGEKLENLNVLEKYDTYYSSNISESLFLHLKRAIDLVIARGIEPFPKIGIGDWNDGFSNLGSKGKGQSIWLGFFFYDNLEKFIQLYEDDFVKEKVDLDFKEKNINFNIDDYKNIKEELKRNLNTAGWDGRWFKRAINDEDDEIGSINSKECKIDGLVQSWSVISNAADNDKKYIAMEEAERYLVDKENGIIKLFVPAFKDVPFNPGYIKAYPEGIRENGGQYTHAAIWFCLAELMLGFNDKAFEFLEMINPISHTDSFEKMNKFKLEPYVMYADLYTNKDMIGTGGWNWYTGSSSWYLNVIIEHVLGLKVKKGYLYIDPKIPSYWNEFEINYRYKTTKYNIKVKRDSMKNNSNKKLYINGKKEENMKIKLENNGQIYKIELFM